jgi:plasmid stability protein
MLLKSLDRQGICAAMDYFREIESAVKHLSAEERRRLILSLAASLREEGRPLPAPRAFRGGEVIDWIKEDERDLARFRGQLWTAAGKV